MKHQFAAKVTSSLTMAAAAVVLASTMACHVEQPPFGCQVQRITWVVRYNLVPGQSVTGLCTQKKGERLGIQIFNDPTKASQQNTLVIQPETLATISDPDESHHPYSLSTSYPDVASNGICVAPDMSIAEKHSPATGTKAARDVVYKWSNVRVVSSPDAPGTQFVGDLEYTEGGCTAKYEAWGNWPSVSCGVSGQPSDEVCASATRLNSAFLLVCDPTQLRCVPGKTPPSYK